MGSLVRGKEKNTRDKTLIKRDKELIDSALREYLSKLKGPSSLLEAMRYTLFSGGKRLRPILTVESCRALRGDIEKALPFACAIELIHNFSLIHDDLPSMDNDDFRRGRPTCHKRFGEGLAILAGDGLLNLAFSIISKTKNKRSLEIISLLSDAVGVENLIGGQVLDLKYKDRLNEGSKTRARINYMKTASLMAVSCKIGSLMAESGGQHVKRMYEFGKNLGCAFQIADDIADIACDRPSLGEMREKARFSISKGKRYLDPLKKKADTLRYIADSIEAKIETG
ncbi:MAG: hypothetical protein A2Z72_06120 [Omnitrophica bacterium RBG_13_46_9]|nr:MAG: hypothetical protein A2Z72_06120 [Omnitrophica bacterium RBG_13_46_9]